MPLFTWKEDYSVAVTELDRHHRELFDIVNRIYSCCVSPDGLDGVSAMIDDLAAYSKYHFAAEEQHMKNIRFKGLESHQAMHLEFSTRIEMMRLSEADNRLDTTRELIVYLGNWLLHHVLEEDKGYVTKDKSA